MNFPTNLRRAMAAKQFEPVHLAAAMADHGQPINSRTVDRWLAGSNLPQVATLGAVADCLDVTPNELLGVTSKAS